MPASRSFFRWWETVGCERSKSGHELADADLAGVLSQHVDELHPHRIAERLCDLGHPLGVLALDVGIDDGLAAGLALGALLSSGRSSRSTGIYLHISIEMTFVNGLALRA